MDGHCGWELKGVRAMGFYTKVVGVTYENRQSYIKDMKIGDDILLVRDYNNPHDKNAIRVVNEAGYQIGFLSKELALQLALSFEKGITYKAKVSNITGREHQGNLGVNIFIEECSVDISADIEAKQESSYVDDYNDDTYYSYASEFPDMEAYESWYESSDF